MITENDKKLLADWLAMNLQITSKSNVELIVAHIDRYFQSPSGSEAWVSVEDRLPFSDKDEIVLVIIYDTMYDVVDSVEYYNGRFTKNSGYDNLAQMGTYMDFTSRTTHWMYKQLLPQPPINK